MLNTSYIFLQEKVHNDHPVCEEREREREKTRRHPPEKDKEGILHRERERENQGVHHMGRKSCNLEPKRFAEETPKDDLDGVLLLWLYRH
jgi:hypothetical protein